MSTLTATLLRSLACSDVDLAVLAPEGWNEALVLQEAVWEDLGNDRNVLVFTQDEFQAKAEAEPVVAEIMRDGIPLVGRQAAP